jgi:hypothetical protein
MTGRRLTILQLNDLHGYLEPHPEAFRGRGKFDYRTCGGLARIASIFKRVRAERPGEVLEPFATQPDPADAARAALAGWLGEGWIGAVLESKRPDGPVATPRRRRSPRSDRR